MPIRKDAQKTVAGKRENGDAENSPREEQAKPKLNKEKCSSATNEMITSQKNQTTKAATRTSKKKKKNRPDEMTRIIRKEIREKRSKKTMGRTRWDV